MYFLSIIVLLSAPLATPLSPAYGDLKEEIANLEKICQSEEISASTRLQLAKAYYRDQNPEKAFKIYLKALAEAPHRTATPCPEESDLYEKGEEIYLRMNQGESPQALGLKLREEFEPVLLQHPDYFLVNYLVASGLANNALFEEFFDAFIKSYEVYPDHYLAFKNKALLVLKLFERSRTLEEKEELRPILIENLKNALAKNHKDVGAYKLVMLFASDKERPEVVDWGLNKIVNDNMIVPRADVIFFVQQGVAAKQIEAAQRFLTKARDWYPSSRVLDASQKYLDQQR